MNPEHLPEELLQHICYSSRLTAAEAQHLITEVLAYFSEPCEAFVRRRHLELQAQGLNNKRIYSQLLNELQQRRFPAPALSERQVRRMIYG